MANQKDVIKLIEEKATELKKAIEAEYKDALNDITADIKISETIELETARGKIKAGILKIPGVVKTGNPTVDFSDDNKALYGISTYIKTPKEILAKRAKKSIMVKERDDSIDAINKKVSAIKRDITLSGCSADIIALVQAFLKIEN